MNHVVRVNNVSKSFRVHSERNLTMKERLIYAGREKFRVFQALKDVSISIEKGSTVGLIGSNGSGKSTLLKLISRILFPDSGSIEVQGRVASLLELGAGFHPDFTGVENIFLNGSLMGLSKRDLRRKMDEIIQFSELGDFIHEPIRSYSSGMYMRLAFSVATVIDPDILLVDEILAVGDAAFQAKCFGRLRQLQASGTTIVIVSHDSGAIERLCDSVVWLHNSRVALTGDPTTCLNSYLRAVSHDRPSNNADGMSFDRALLPTNEVLVSDHHDKPLLRQACSGDLVVDNVRLTVCENASSSRILLLRISKGTSDPKESQHQDVLVGFGIDGINGRLYQLEHLLPANESKVGMTWELALDISRFGLPTGDYTIDIWARSARGQLHTYLESVVALSVINEEKGSIVACESVSNIAPNLPEG